MRFLLLLAMLLSPFAAAADDVTPEAMHALALDHRDTLALSAYITANNVRKLASEDLGRIESLKVLHGMGITKVYLEVYRSGTVLTPEELTRVRDFYLDNDFAVAAGIATVPGGDFGVQQDRGLGWFNWQNEKTQRDLEAVVRMAAPLFDEFVVDDFLCTDDQSPESVAAKGDRTWSEYRRDLLVELSQKIFIGPAKEENPDITMVIKYPQWYDLFHRFGYDVERQPQLFDKVYVGTETRGAKTPRFGYIQPYLGFVNYRWLAEIAGDKIGAAWFDHGDCDANDFLDQAWQTVLAGAKEIILFNYGNLAEGHPGHQLLRNDFAKLTQLAAAVAEHPVVGIPAYKPMNSDAGGDMYIMDALGMLGIPLVPTATFPEDAYTIFLPAQAADDPEVERKLREAIEWGTDVIVTAGFLAKMAHTNLHQMAGLNSPVTSNPTAIDKISFVDNLDTVAVNFKSPFFVEAQLDMGDARATLMGGTKDEWIPLYTSHSNPDKHYREFSGLRPPNRKITVINLHTYDQQDFDSAGEVLLAPRPLAILDIPEHLMWTYRRAFGATILIHGPSRITSQQLSDGTYVVQNYNDEFVATISAAEASWNVFTGDSGTGILNLKARDRIWIKVAFSCHMCGV